MEKDRKYFRDCSLKKRIVHLDGAASHLTIQRRDWLMVRRRIVSRQRGDESHCLTIHRNELKGWNKKKKEKIV